MELGVKIYKKIYDTYLLLMKIMFNDVKAILSLAADSDYRIVVAKLNLTKLKQKLRQSRMRLN